MSTPLLPTFEKRITDAVSRLLHEQLDPWIFMREHLSVKRHDGRDISYAGIEFEGSPRRVFWGGYMEPFLQDMITTELRAAASIAKERDVDGHALIQEVRGLLLSGCRCVYQRMAEVDRLLLGCGFPQSVPLRDIEPKIEAVRQFLDRHADAELQMWKPRPWYECWYDRNKFWVWIAGLAVGIGGLAVKFL